VRHSIEQFKYALGKSFELGAILKTAFALLKSTMNLRSCIQDWLEGIGRDSRACQGGEENELVHH
jgi:hypothetical protein